MTEETFQEFRDRVLKKWGADTVFGETPTGIVNRICHGREATMLHDSSGNGGDGLDDRVQIAYDFTDRFGVHSSPLEDFPPNRKRHREPPDAE